MRDWYNLEEAKQVKAFRCGDHNSCIEKAEALQANPSNRRLKLTQRENAIILALELETALMSKELRSWSDKVKRKRTPNRSEDNGSERIKKRMRGLDDMGLGSNMKQLTELVTESAPQGPSSLGDLCSFNHLPIKSIVNRNGGVCMAYIKKKRSKVVFQEILKQEDSIDLLPKVLQSDTLVSVPIIYDELPSPCKDWIASDAQAQDYPLSSSMPELLGYDSSDNLFDVLLISDEELFEGFPPHITGSSAVEALTTEAQIDSGSAQETEKDPLVWQSKGKRNPRHQSRNLKLDCKKPTDSKADLSDPEDQLDRHEIPEPFIRRTNAESVVYDVYIEVEASYSPQHVPNKSLMGILNRKPVSGHHINLEVLEDGESDFMSELDEDYEPTETRTHLSKTQKPGSLTRKTRTLSSLTPTLACIPIKVLFNRIHVVLNGSISIGNCVA